jgi:hypothetical protein
MTVIRWALGAVDAILQHDACALACRWKGLETAERSGNRGSGCQTASLRDTDLAATARVAGGRARARPAPSSTRRRKLMQRNAFWRKPRSWSAFARPVPCSGDPFLVRIVSLCSPALTRCVGQGFGVIHCAKKLGKGESDVRHITETFRRNPAGSQSRLVELASSQKRVLRPLGRPTGRSVDSECRCRVIEPRNYLSWRALVVECAWGRAELP